MARHPPQPLTAADSAWLRMEDPTNLMNVTAVLMFRDPVDFTRLTRLLEERFLIHDRFRQRVAESPGRLGRPRWEGYDAFRLEEHLHRVRLPEPADEPALQELVSRVMSTPLEHDKALWHFYLVENFARGSALVARLHHCIGDGLALVHVLLGLTDSGPEPDAMPTADAGVRFSFNVRGSRHSLLGRVRAAGSAIRTLGKLATMRADPQTALKGRLGPSKRAIWSRRIPLHDVKYIGQALGATVNDVLLTAVAGALRSYLSTHHAVRPTLNVRAVVPVNLRPPADPSPLGNRFGLVFLSLPLGLETPLARLQELKRRMDVLKRSAEAAVVFALIRMLGGTAAAVEMMVVNLLGKNATAVMTNVPGPREPLYLAGSRIDDLVFWVPQSGRLSLGVSIFSYCGGVRIGVAVDRGLVAEPERIVRAFHESLDELMASARAAGGSAASVAARA